MISARCQQCLAKGATTRRQELSAQLGFRRSYFDSVPTLVPSSFFRNAQKLQACGFVVALSHEIAAQQYCQRLDSLPKVCHISPSRHSRVPRLLEPLVCRIVTRPRRDCAEGKQASQLGRTDALKFSRLYLQQPHPYRGCRRASDSDAGNNQLDVPRQQTADEQGRIEQRVRNSAGQTWHSQAARLPAGSPSDGYSNARCLSAEVGSYCRQRVVSDV